MADVDVCAAHGRPYKTYRQMANGLLAPHCTWDGSLHPDVFMEWLEKPGTSLVPTDKNYKVYIRVKDGESNPDELRVVSLITHDSFGGMEGWRPVDDEVRAIIERDGGWGEPDERGYKWAILAPRGSDCEDKFYFEHLSAEQRTRFVELLNSGKIAFEYPGHFYRRPFFITTGAA